MNCATAVPTFRRFRPLDTPDRFIPNRSKMDLSRIRATLSRNHATTTTTTTTTSDNDEYEATHCYKTFRYKQRLRRALWGTGLERQDRLMSFGYPEQSKNNSGVTIGNKHLP